VEIQDIGKFLKNPLLYVLIGLITLLFIKKHRLKITIMLLLYFYFMSITFTGYAFSRLWKICDTFDDKKVYDAVIVLSGVSNANWHIDRKDLPYIPDDFFVATDNSDRILAGAYFVKSGHAKLLLIGDWVYETYSEGVYVKKLLSDIGLMDEQVQIYSQIKRTLDEVKGVKQYLEKKQLKEILLITSEKHMRRALAMFKRQGLHPDVFSVNKESELDWEFFIPSIDGIMKTDGCFYEVVAYGGYFLKGDI
jgi:uncharacterized SAM-binding protein YcdF (DUF218 family)